LESIGAIQTAACPGTNHSLSPPEAVPKLKGTLRANEKWKSTLALPKVETYQWGGAIHPDDLPAARQVYDVAMRTRTGFLNPIEFRLRAGALKDTWIDVSASLSLASLSRRDNFWQVVYDLQPEFTSDISGELVGWVGVWSDVSNLRRLQRNAVETERAHTQEAERSRELQEQFIDITCHELRNPLNAIYNSAAMLGESLAGIDGRLAALREESRVERHSSLEKIHAELQEDIDSANTIVLCARHQKRIVDGVLPYYFLSLTSF
jgi:signal transduction histidine kinase